VKLTKGLLKEKRKWARQGFTKKGVTGGTRRQIQNIGLGEECHQTKGIFTSRSYLEENAKKLCRIKTNINEPNVKG